MSKVPQNIVIKETKDFETFTVEKTSSELNTNVETGLSEEEAKVRLEKYGPNKLEEKKKKTWIKIFFEQLNNPMIFVLFGAILVTLIVSIYETIHLSSLLNDPTNPELIHFLTNNGYTSINQINWFLDVGDWPDVLIILAVVFINSIIGTV